MLRPKRRSLFLQVLTAVLVTGLHGQPSGRHLSFAVASIKAAPPGSETHLTLDYCRPDGSFAVKGAPLFWSLKYAFQRPGYALAGAPSWLSDFSSAYNIEAKPDEKADNGQCRAMLQSLFSDRFHLLTHHENRPTSVYFLRVSRKGGKVKPGGGVHLNRSVQVNADGAPQWPDGWSMGQLAKFLAGILDRPVIDQTGLAGDYGVTLEYSRRQEDGLPDILTAVQEQLGLKLFSGKASIDMLVIDHIQQPDPD